MLERRLEPEVMDTPEEARDYDAMDHAAVNRAFVDDFMAFWRGEPIAPLLDLGTGTAQIIVEFCHRVESIRVVGIDLSLEMLRVAARNVQAVQFDSTVELRQADAKALPFADGEFGAVMSNSIVHHIPEPRSVLAEAVRVTRPGGLLFVRDLLRPSDQSALERLVDLYTAGATAHQRQMFADSLHAALTPDEIRALVGGLGFGRATVKATSDRHWTWAAVKPGAAPR